ncbi:hypothetical protein TNCV_3597371 [Trichonephila clavipes]|nr:hypothetical protein TNCV_3597371 [Trichonephila clavipes]
MHTSDPSKLRYLVQSLYAAAEPCCPISGFDQFPSTERYTGITGHCFARPTNANTSYSCPCHLSKFLEKHFCQFQTLVHHSASNVLLQACRLLYLV